MQPGHNYDIVNDEDLLAGSPPPRLRLSNANKTYIPERNIPNLEAFGEVYPPPAGLESLSGAPNALKHNEGGAGPMMPSPS